MKFVVKVRWLYFSFANPRLWIELSSFLAQLEVQDVVALSIVGHGAEDVAGFHFLAALDNGRGEVAVDGDVGAVADEDVFQRA